MRRVLLVLLLSAGLCAGRAFDASAQSTSRPSTAIAPYAAADTVDTAGDRYRFGIGVHLGWPTGVAVRIPGPNRDLHLLAAWRLDRFLFAHGHLTLVNEPLPIDAPVRYYGGGGLAGHVREGRFHVGPSLVIGVRYLLPPVDVFLQSAPRLEVVPVLRLRVAVGVGATIRL